MALGVTRYGIKPVKKVVGNNSKDPLGLGNDDEEEGGSGYTYMGSGNSSSGQTLAAAKIRAATDAAKLKFEQDKLAAEQVSNAEALARAAAGRQAQGDYLRGQFQTGDPSSFGDIEAQNVASQNYINTQATNLLARLAGAKTTATDLTTTGYDNLKNYLGANVPQAYATAQNAVAPITTNALAQYMASRGVDQQPVQGAVDTANAGLASSAGNFNQLLNVLRGAETSGQQSRLSEEQMARALAGSNLEATYGAGRAGVESEQLSALNQLATQISNARLQAKAVQDARNQALQDALATLLGQGYVQPADKNDGNTNDDDSEVSRTFEGSGASRVRVTKWSSGRTTREPDPTDTGFVPAPPPEQGTGGGVTKSPSGVATSPAVSELLNTAAARRTDNPTAVTNRIWDFVEQNPSANKAQVLAEFPNLQGLAKLKASRQ